MLYRGERGAAASPSAHAKISAISCALVVNVNRPHIAGTCASSGTEADERPSIGPREGGAPPTTGVRRGALPARRARRGPCSDAARRTSAASARTRRRDGPNRPNAALE